MHFAIITDVFPPLRSSGAVQLRDLSTEFVRQGHRVTVLTPAPIQATPWVVETWNEVRVVRLRSMKTKDTNYVQRTIGELLMPYIMLWHLRRSPLVSEQYDGVIWYSPTIFLGPMAKALKNESACKGYLIIRDIFPDWAVDMGLMGKGLPYLFFRSVANFQYSVADVIGVQTPGNLDYFSQWIQTGGRKVEVLQNWLSETPIASCSINIASTALAGRKIFVYAGNMGVAQGIDVLLDLAESLLPRKDIGFLFVGRGRESYRLKVDATLKGLENVLFYDEIDPAEIPGLYAQCRIGLIALDSRHKSHNIPGKFLTYMQGGLPVLAIINEGNDLERLIHDEHVGVVSETRSIQSLNILANELIEILDVDKDISIRCKSLCKRLFSTESAVQQILNALNA